MADDLEQVRIELASARERGDLLCSQLHKSRGANQDLPAKSSQ